MSTKATVIACVNQKGGTGKTTTCENLGAGLVMNGKKVLLVDFDPQASLSISLGYPKPEELPVTIADMMKKVVDEKEIRPGEGILHHEEGMDLMPSSIELSGMEVALVNTISRETVLKEYLESVKRDYDFVLLDCSPSLGMLTINAMAAADTLLIPVLCETFCYAHHSSGPGMFICLNPKNDTHNVYLNPQSFASSSSSSQSGSSISLSSSFFSIAFRN